MLNFIKTHKLLTIILLVVISISLIFILPSKSGNLCQSKSSYFDFDSINKTDYEYMIKNYDSSDVRYFESQGKLAKSLYEVTDPKVTWIKNVFAVKDTVITFTHDTAFSEVKISKIQSYWLEDQVTTPYCTITLGKAIELINESNITRPKSKVFVLRRPLYPPFPDHNYYIFGDWGHSPFIQVDSESGEVNICEF